MSLEAMEKITEMEVEMGRRKTQAEQKARELKEAARAAGEALLVQVRREAEEEERALLAAAEQRAAQRCETLDRETEEKADTLRREGEKRLAEAVDFIVERVVKD